MKIVAFSILLIIHVTFCLEHPSTYQQSEQAYTYQPQIEINANQQYDEPRYEQPQIQQNIAQHGQEVIQNIQPTYSEYSQVQNVAQTRENVQYVPTNQGQVDSGKYSSFLYPSPQNLYVDVGPKPSQSKNAPSNGYKVREIQSEDQPNHGSFLQSDDADYYTSGFGNPYHFASPEQHVYAQPQGVVPQQQQVASQQYQNTYNVFTDSVQNPSNTGLHAYRTPQQHFMNSGL